MLLEREGERGALRGRLRRAARGRGGCVLVSGPAGIGKSRLLAEARALAADAGVAVLTARGSELEREFAFGAVHQLFERELVELAPGERTAMFAGAASRAAAVFSLAGGDAEDDQEPSHAVLHGLYWLTVGFARRAPLALIVDDAHWLDAPSLRWLAYMVNRIDELPLALVVATRPYEADQDVLKRIALHPSTRVLAPGALSQAAVGALAAQALGAEPDRDFVRACAEATQGNPFYLQALLGALARERVVPSASELGRVRTVMPASVVDSVELRLRRLPAACRELARAVAVLGAVASGEAASALAGLDRAAAEAATAQLAQVEILREDGSGFVHPLVRDAVYSALPSGERSQLHAAAARLLTDTGAPADRIAVQLLASEPGAVPGAAEQLRRAARGAWVRGAPDLAASFLERALSEPVEPRERGEILRELAPAVTATRGPEGLAHLREALELADTPALRADVALQLGRALFTQGFFSESAEVFERACAAADGLPIAGDLRGQLAAIALLDLDVLGRMGGLEAVAAMAGRAGGVDAATRAWVLAATEGPADRAADLAEEALADERLAFGREPISVGAGVVALLTAGRLERANDICGEIIAAARASAALATLRFVLSLRAMVLVRLGHVAAAEADVRELLDWVSDLPIALDEYRVALPWVVSPLVVALIERSELDEAERWVAVTDAEAEMPEVLGFNYLLEALAMLRLARGRPGEAVALMRECGRRLRAWGIRNPAFLPWRSGLARALAATGELDEAAALAREEIELAERFAVARERGIALRTLAELSAGDERIYLLREAARSLERSPAELERARALTELGAALRARGDDTGAREPLRAALDLALRCGASVLARRAQQELVAAGARPRRLTLSGPGALTGSELRVARLAADGLTNRQIAEALFVTEKTVEGHLGNAYRKLDISSRTQLPAALGDVAARA